MLEHNSLVDVRAAIFWPEKARLSYLLGLIIGARHQCARRGGGLLQSYGFHAARLRL